MMGHQEKFLNILQNAELPAFKSGADGFPLPGPVVRHYREHMMYADRDNRVKHWTQCDLAQRLKVTELTVRLMETQNKFLDSIERRRALATLLKIPPVLLGLSSLDLIVEVATGQATPAQEEIKLTPDTLQNYQKSYTVYEKLFASGATFNVAASIERQTKQIAYTVQNMQIKGKTDFLRSLWDYEILCAKIYGSDLYDWTKTFEHIDNAKEIAALLDDRDLQAATLYTSGLYHQRQGRLGLAKADIDGALMYAKGALPQTRGLIYSLEATQCLETQGLAGSALIYKLLDYAEQYAGVKSERKTLKFGIGTLYIHKADDLIDLKRPAKALEYVDMAEKHINPTKKRLLVYLNILRARCYIELRKPEYEQAAKLLAESIEYSQAIRVQRHIDYIERLYTKLAASSYGKSPDVADLGFMLQELRRTV
ncbi:MAG TPA: hypothetical protein VFV38_38210 [Ktedonobacteraceae bacterium]|nr:hypothetical protein [Ktedonobacteraceae bacterium]